MLTTTEGIVLQSTKYFDNSLIVRIFTKKNGTISCMVKSAFSKTTKQPASFFTPLTLLNVTYKETYTEKITFLKEVSIAHPFHTISMNIKKNCVLLFYQELLMKLLYSANAPDNELFDFIKTHLLELEATQTIAPDIHLVFLVQLIHQLGYAPELNFSVQTPYFSIEESNFGNTFLETPTFLSKEASFYLYNILKKNNYVTPDKRIRMELLDGMLRYLMKEHKQIHEIDSVSILEEVLK